MLKSVLRDLHRDREMSSIATIDLVFSSSEDDDGIFVDENQDVLVVLPANRRTSHQEAPPPVFEALQNRKQLMEVVFIIRKEGNR